MITGIMLRAIIQYINSQKVKYIRKFRVLDEDKFALIIKAEDSSLNIVFSPKQNYFLPVNVPLKSVIDVEKDVVKKYNTLKRFLENARILAINQPELERIVDIELFKGMKKYRLIIELFREGNIILTDEKLSILFLQHSLFVKDRILKVGEVYKFPPKRTLFSDLTYVFNNPSEVVRAINKLKDIFRVFPLDKYTLNYVIKKVNVDTYKDLNSAVYAIIDELKNLVSDFKDYCIIEDRGQYIILPFKPDIELFNILSCFNNLLDATTNYYRLVIGKDKHLKLESKIRDIERKIKELEARKKDLIKNISELEQRVIPQLYIYIYELDTILSSLRRKLEPIETENFVVEKFDTKNKIAKIGLKKLNTSVKLKYTLSTYEAIGQLYEELKRMKSGVKKIEEKISEFHNRIRKLQEEHLKEREEEEEVFRYRIRKRKWFERFLWFFTSKNRLLVIAGRDAVSNEVLIKKYASNDDIVLHADIYGSPFAVIKGEKDKEPDNEDLYEAAVFVASYSSGWKSGFSSLDVYWVKKGQVSKSAPSGEYLPKGSFMIYGKKNFLRGVPLNLYVGILYLDDKPVVYIAPEQSVLKYCKEIIGKLVPNSQERYNIAMKIVEKVCVLLKIKPPKEIFQDMVSEVVNKLPPGRSTLIFM